MAYCTSCGARLASSDKFCPNCGCMVESQPPVVTKAGKRRKGISKWAYIIGAVAAVVVIAVLAALLAGGSTIERVLVQNRGTCFCPGCQPLGSRPTI